MTRPRSAIEDEHDDSGVVGKSTHKKPRGRWGLDVRYPGAPWFGKWRIFGRYATKARAEQAVRQLLKPHFLNRYYKCETRIVDLGLMGKGKP